MTAARLWQVTVRTTARGEEAVAGFLERVCGTPASVYVSEESGAVDVTVYPEALPATRAALRGGLKALGADKAELSIKRLRRENWAESWKRHFKPVEIGKELLIKPGWSRRRARAGQRVVILDPGLSFGTGHHPTTLFCLQQLARCRRRGVKQSFLDIGTGSGILAIAAAKLGYSPVEALDNDTEAVRWARQNIRRNHVRVALRQADLGRLPMKPRKRYDVICANLVCELLVLESEKIGNLLKTGGKLIAAGVLHRDFHELEKKLREGTLTLQRSKVNKDWKSGQFALLRFRSPDSAT